MNSAHRLYSLQYLRGIAASLVVLFHFYEGVERYYSRYGLISNTFTNHYQKYQDILAIGVDIFFVVSGVVMVISTENLQPRGKALFLLRRILRIIPLYWVLTIGYAMLILIVPEYFFEIKVEPSHLVKSLLLIPATAPNGEVFPLLFQGWTLTYEIIFYTIFSLSMFIPKRNNALLTCAFLLILWHFIFYCSISSSVIISRTTDNIILEFIFGLIIGSLWVNKKLPVKFCEITFLLSFFGIILALHFSNTTPKIPRAILWGLPSSFLVAAFLIYEYRNLSRVPNKTLLFIGKISYSIYLSHAIALSTFFFFTEKIGVLALTPIWILALLSFLFSIV